MYAHYSSNFFKPKRSYPKASSPPKMTKRKTPSPVPTKASASDEKEKKKSKSKSPSKIELTSSEIERHGPVNHPLPRKSFFDRLRTFNKPKPAKAHSHGHHDH